MGSLLLASINSIHTIVFHTENMENRGTLDAFDPTPSKDYGQRILFTGPDGMCDQTMKIENEHRYIGIGTMSKEGTSELDFLCRQGPNPPGQSYFAMKRKHQTLGAIGWGHEDATFLNRKLTGQKCYNYPRGEFRQAAEDRYTHLYQSPWYPDPKDKKLEKKKDTTTKKDSTKYIGVDIG